MILEFKLSSIFTLYDSNENFVLSSEKETSLDSRTTSLDSIMENNEQDRNIVRIWTLQQDILMMKFIVLWLLLPNVTFFSKTKQYKTVNFTTLVECKELFFEMQGSAYLPCS